MQTKVYFKDAGFSLVEVVVAIGIFSLAIVGVLGLLSPTTKNVTDVADSDSATRVVVAIQSALQETVSSSSTGFTDLGTSLQAPTGGATPIYNYYSTRDGHVVGQNQAFTNAGLNNADKFFEFALLRNTTLSPSGNDTTAGYLAFTISLRWPAYFADGSQVNDDAQKSTMIVSAAVTR